MSHDSVDVEAVARTYDSGILVRRWAATMLDLVVLIPLSYGLIIGSIALATSEETAILTGLVLVVLASLTYYFVLEGLTGLTFGKLILGIRVVKADGKPPGLVKSLGRTLLRLLEANPILLGGVPAGIAASFSPTKQRIGDMLASTYVVCKKDLTSSGQIVDPWKQKTEAPDLSGGES